MNKLAALRSKGGSPVPAPTKGAKGGLAGMEDFMLDGMSRGLVKIGAVSAMKSGKDWTKKTVEIVPGVSITASLPSVPLVEMDGMDLVTGMVKAADQVFPKVAQALHTEVAQAIQSPFAKSPAHGLLGIEIGGGYSRADIVVAVTRKLLVVQDWKYIQTFKRWQSPAWLYPAIMLRWDTLEELVRDEVKLMEAGKLIAPEPESDLLPTEV